MFVAHLDDLRHQLDLHVFLTGVLNVRIVDRRDAVGEDALRGDVGSQRMHGDDHQLEQRVVALDVERGVAFGEAQRLRLREGVGVGVLVVEDAREDVVRRAVQNALDLQQQVVVVVLFEVADHGDRAARRSVVEQRHVAGFLNLDQLGEVFGEHRLAARHDRDAAQHGPFDDVVGGIGIVDDLHHEVDVLVVEDVVDRGGEQRRVDFDLARLFGVADADFHDFGVGVLRFAHHFVDALSDDAESEQSDFDFGHGVSGF